MTTLFEATANLGPETVTAEVLKAALCGTTDPRTMAYFEDPEYTFYDSVALGNWQEGTSVTHPALGTITLLKVWGERTDETETGQAVRHEDTGKVYLATGVYFSWDGEPIDTLVEAEEYTFTEQRWRQK